MNLIRRTVLRCAISHSHVPLTMPPKKKKSLGRPPNIKKEKLLNLCEVRKSEIIQNGVLKKISEPVFEELATEVQMSRNATYLAVQRNINRLFGDDLLDASNNSTALLDQNSSILETTASDVERNETPVMKKCSVRLIRLGNPVISKLEEDVFIFDANEENIFSVLSKMVNLKRRFYAEPGWSDKLNDFMWEKLRYGCTWAFKRARVRELDIICEGTRQAFFCIITK